MRSLEEQFRSMRSFEEVAAIMTANGYPITRSGVQYVERTALRKLSRDKILKEIFSEWIELQAEKAKRQRLARASRKSKTKHD